MNIKSITKGLDKMVKNLDKYAAQQEIQIKVNCEKIDQLAANNLVHTKEATKADKIANNIRQILEG